MQSKSIFQLNCYGWIGLADTSLRDDLIRAGAVFSISYFGPATDLDQWSSANARRSHILSILNVSVNLCTETQDMINFDKFCKFGVVFVVSAFVVGYGSYTMPLCCVFLSRHCLARGREHSTNHPTMYMQVDCRDNNSTVATILPCMHVDCRQCVHCPVSRRRHPRRWQRPFVGSFVLYFNPSLDQHRHPCHNNLSSS